MLRTHTAWLHSSYWADRWKVWSNLTAIKSSRLNSSKKAGQYKRLGRLTRSSRSRSRALRILQIIRYKISLRLLHFHCQTKRVHKRFLQMKLICSLYNINRSMRKLHLSKIKTMTITYLLKLLTNFSHQSGLSQQLCFRIYKTITKLTSYPPKTKPHTKITSE